MVSVLQIALGAATALTAASGLLGALSLRVKTKADIASGLRQMQAQVMRDEAALDIDGRRLSQAEKDMAFDHMQGLFTSACAERDRYERLYREAQTALDLMRKGNK